MAECAAVSQTCSDGQIDVEVTRSVLFVRPLSLGMREFALEQLSSATDRSKRVTVDDEDRRSRCRDVTPSRADLFQQRFVNTRVNVVLRLSVVNHLRGRNW